MHKTMKNIFREIKIPFICLSVLFVLCLALGYISGNSHPDEAKNLFDKLFESFSSLKSVNVLAIFFFIFVNNSVKTLGMFLFGTFFGIIPILFIAINGVLIGIMSSVVITKHGASYLFAGTIPHGILEIPAMLIAASYGLQLGRRYFRKLKYSEPFKPHLLKMTGKLFRYVIPLLAIASFVETFITMTILRSL